MFQGQTTNFSNNGLWNRIIQELNSIKEVELEDPQINFPVAKLIDKVVKRGGDSFNEQPRKNGLRYFTILSVLIAIRKLTLIPHNNKQLHLNYCFN